MIDFENNTDVESHISAYAILSCAMTDFGRSSGNCVWDLSAVTPGGKTVSIEVKARSFEHDRFGDVFAEDAKQTYTRQNYRFDISLAVNTYTDGYVAMANLYDPKARHFTRMCPKETWPGGDHTLVMKNCLSLPQTALFKVGADGKFHKIDDTRKTATR